MISGLAPATALAPVGPGSGLKVQSPATVLWGLTPASKQQAGIYPYSKHTHE